MKIEYDESNNLWIITKKVGEKEIEIRITEWFATEKGRLIDIAVFISEDGESKEAKENEFFYDFEILTNKLLAKQIPEVSKVIIESYDEINRNINISGAVRDISTVFPRCNIDAYYRKSGYERETKIYVGRRIGLFGYASKQIYYEFNGEKKIFPKATLEYPGSRLDCICD